jgi:hypothetical protein
MDNAWIASFLSDPWKIILGSGGIAGLVGLGLGWWRARARPRVRLLGQTYHPNGQYDCPSEVEVEIENVGREPTSVEPFVPMTCQYPKGGAIACDFQVTDADRSLAPVTPRKFRVTGRPPVGYIYSHFRVYTFKFTRGGSAKLRVLNASGHTAGPLKFWFLKWLFILKGALPHVEG